ncbi:PREDICTED: probable multidrug resistance-associated protein lethal(2)03659 [Nicrophorus vespilloides]|uniref:Probable multidrug resistance-associated protein lethal(2)03659 n=1 Tax=Nicrophorus vespilloides TaxID=110193 RepID=A0ABM1MTH8_NICVS|nr:PREDICTED: probable multidrug resistance-associated protein lethal(2)03659 [Nicrophorus vespilloides]
MRMSRGRYNVSPEVNANVFSAMFFWYQNSISLPGKNKMLEEADLYNTAAADLADPLGQTLDEYWKIEVAKARRRRKKPSLLKALYKTFVAAYMGYGLMLFIQCIIFKMLQPIIMFRLIHYFMYPSESGIKFGIMKAAIFVVVAFLNVLMYHHTLLGCHKIGTRCKIACSSLIYKKFLKLSLVTIHNKQLQNEVTTLLNKQTRMLEKVPVFLHFVWITPLQIMIILLEQHYVRSFSYVMGFTTILINFSARLGIFVTVSSYELSKTLFSTQLLYTIIQFLNLIELQMAVLLPMGIKSYMDLIKATKKIKEFLLLPEIDAAMRSKPREDAGHVNMIDITATWIMIPRLYTLVNLNLDLFAGNIYALTGPPSSGKSSFLNIILNEVPVLRGTCTTMGRLSYAAQKPWIFNSSVRHNIILDRKFDRNRYNFVVKVCQLANDFRDWRYSDNSIIGEHIALDLNQRAKINIARAVYRSADIYLFDECFDDLEVDTAEKVFKYCLKKYLKRNKTVILVTNILELLEQSDQMLLIKNASVTMTAFDDIPKTEIAKYRWIRTGYDGRKVLREISLSRIKPIGDSREFDHAKVKKLLIQKYLKHYSKKPAQVLFLFTLFVTQCVVNAGDFWLMLWASSEEQCYMKASDVNETKDIKIFDFPLNKLLRRDVEIAKKYENKTFHDQCNYILPNETFFIYYIALVGATFFMVVYYVILFCELRSRGSKIYKDTFNNILHATMDYYYTNTIVKIIRKLMRDIRAVDMTLPNRLLDVLTINSTCLGFLIVISVFVPASIPICIIILFGLYKLHKIFKPTTDGIVSLDGETRNKITDHVQDTVSALVTIRCHNAQGMAIREFHDLYDVNTSASSTIVVLWRMYGCYIDLFYTFLMAFVIFQYFVVPDFIPYLTTSIVGLLITNCFYLIGFVQYGMKQMNKISHNLYSVQHLINLEDIDKEPQGQTIVPDKTWPVDGNIQFSDVTMILEYLEPIYSIEMNIPTGNKIGIMGDTLSGKRSLIPALYRIFDYDGLITLSDVDIKSVNLHDLRLKISIMPSDPVVFPTSVRNNLDIHGNVSTDSILQALKLVHGELHNVLVKLDRQIQNENFTMEHRHIISLLRVVLQKNKILIVEECETRLEKETEYFIQQVINEKFMKNTVIQITNNLSNIIKYDLIFYMAKGRIVESGSAVELLNQKSENIKKYFDRMYPEEQERYRTELQISV